MKKKQVEDIKKLKLDLEQAKQEMEKAERLVDLATVAKLKYGRIPDLEKAIAKSETKDSANSNVKSRQLLKESVDPEDIAEVVSKWTGIPVSKMLESEVQKLLDLENQLKKHVVGQDHALEILSDAIRRSRAEISDPNRPIGSFIFSGPTGVGKTETVKALARILFNDEQNIIRLDMSEYMEKHSVARLFGAPPGYVGYEEGGQLTEKVRRQPYSVLLLDEIEKAHPDVFNSLLQLLDDGRLTDGQGRTVDFRNTVVIMTTNLGTGGAKKINEFFRPEFINRIDDVIEFHSLDQKNIIHVVDIQMAHVIERLKQKKINLEIDTTAKELLSKLGFDPQFGARPLKRVIQNKVLNPLAKMMISGQLQGGKTVRLAANNGEFEFETL